MSTFELGAGVQCNLEVLVDSRLLIQANSGGGKSQTIRRLLEQTHGRVQHLVIDPEGDGRRRFAQAMNALDPSDKVTEKTVSAALYGVTETEPDLVVVLGPPTQLPPSLVWELAYAELVFIPVSWHDFGAADLAAAVVDFAGRRRRFGGLDDE